MTNIAVTWCREDLLLLTYNACTVLLMERQYSHRLPTEIQRFHYCMCYFHTNNERKYLAKVSIVALVTLINQRRINSQQDIVMFSDT